MSSTRRQFLLASIGGLTACAGCSALSNPTQSLVIGVYNYQDVPRQGFVSIERDGRELVSQYVEVGAAEEDDWPTVETRVNLGKLPDGTLLDVTASFGDGLETAGSIELSCADSSRYVGDAVKVQLDAEGTLYLTEMCYAEFPTVSVEPTQA